MQPVEVHDRRVGEGYNAETGDGAVGTDVVIACRGGVLAAAESCPVGGVADDGGVVGGRGFGAGNEAGGGVRGFGHVMCDVGEGDGGAGGGEFVGDDEIGAVGLGKGASVCIYVCTHVGGG